MEYFLKNSLGCIPGKMEWQKQRLRLISFNSQRFETQLAEFKDDVATWRTNGLIIEFGEAEAAPTVAFQAQQMASLLAPFFLLQWEQLVDEGVLSFDISMPCPITHQITQYEFFGVAFTNRSRNPSDILYDPPQYMPYPAVLFSCDALSFAHYTRDLSFTQYEREVFELSNEERAKLLEQSIINWNKYTIRTLNIFKSICPHIKIDDTGEYWHANHRDPVFSELSKRLHTHDMPVRYCREIVDQWQRTFKKNGVAKINKVRGGQNGFLSTDLVSEKK